MIVYRDIKHQVWYGCYMKKNYIDCMGPFDSSYMTELHLGVELPSPISYQIISTCAFMPEFIRRIKINHKLFVGRDQPLPVVFTKI